MPVLDEWERHDDAEEREMPLVSMCLGDELLTPQPPAGWWCMVRYDSRDTPVGPLEIACWYIAVTHAQHWSRTAGRRLHMIAREPDGQRVLAVHSTLGEHAEQAVDEMNDHRTGYASNCGGYSTMQPLLQTRASRVFVRRLWARIPLSALIGALDDCDLPPALLMQPGSAWLDQVDQAEVLYGMAEATLPTWRR